MTEVTAARRWPPRRRTNCCWGADWRRRRGLPSLSCVSWLPTPGSPVSDGLAGFPRPRRARLPEAWGLGVCSAGRGLREGAARRRQQSLRVSDLGGPRFPWLGLGFLYLELRDRRRGRPGPVRSCERPLGGLGACGLRRLRGSDLAGVSEIQSSGQPGTLPLLLLQILHRASCPPYPKIAVGLASNLVAIKERFTRRAFSFLVSVTFNFLGIKSCLEPGFYNIRGRSSL